jgi:drug/metabolite transporter (DMT)-like permease
MHKETRQAVLWAGLALLMWSTVATAFKLSLRYCTPYELLFVSVLTASVVINGAGLIQKRHRSLSRKGIAQALVTGMLMPLIYYTVLFIAYDRLPAQSAQIVNFTWPVFMAAAAMLLKREPVHLKRILFLLISLTGAVVVITRGTFSLRGAADLPGSLLALGSALLWTAFWMFQSKIDLPGTLRMGLYFTGAFLILLTLSLMGIPLIPSRPEAWIGGIYTGLFEMSLPFLVWQKALEKTRSVAVISNVIYLSPFISLLYIRAILHEPIHISSLAGLFLITGGLILQMNVKERAD